MTGRQVDPGQQRLQIQRAIARLREARNALAAAGAPRALAKVRVALASAYGAERAAHSRLHKGRP